MKYIWDYKESLGKGGEHLPKLKDLIDGIKSLGNQIKDEDLQELGSLEESKEQIDSSSINTSMRYDPENPGEKNLVLLVRLLQKENIKLAIDDALSKGNDNELRIYMLALLFNLAQCGKVNEQEEQKKDLMYDNLSQPLFKKASYEAYS